MQSSATLEQIPTIVQRLRKSFQAGTTRPVEWRQRQLSRLHDMFTQHEQDFVEALQSDLRKPTFEAMAAETRFLIAEIDFSRKHLDEWMKPEKVSTPIVLQPGSSSIVREPLGVNLIIAPWNYPLQLTIGPLIGAIAAGNCAVLKPSELTPATSAVIAKYLPQFLDNDCFQVVQGAVPETTALLEERWDHIFFTGGEVVGKIVMQAAAKHLTPVTLELGGKSPCIVDRDIDLKVTARRIIWGKFFNAGQTCVAPDYVLVHERAQEGLLQAMKEAIRTFFGPNPRASKDLARIVNQRHFERLLALLDDDVQVVAGGEHDADTRYIAPTILRDVSPESKVMQGEIFGPILPVLPVLSVQEAINFVNDRPRPLALYVFSNDKKIHDLVISTTSSGGACVNDTISHTVSPHLPFGGVGNSGMGAYHGRASFEVFSHRKSVLNRSTWIDPNIRYPPYSDGKVKLIKHLM